MDSDFWQGLRLVSSGLADAATKASYSVACGASGLGFALWGITKLGVTGPASLLIPTGVFFLLARIGRVLDVRAEHRNVEVRLEEYFVIQQRISEAQLNVARQTSEMASSVRQQNEYLRIQNQRQIDELREAAFTRTNTLE